MEREVEAPPRIVSEWIKMVSEEEEDFTEHESFFDQHESFEPLVAEQKFGNEPIEQSFGN